jgi:diguanylate cyclase (GGDEF)-like protein
LTVFLYVSLKRRLDKNFFKAGDNYGNLKQEYDNLAQENIRLKRGNADLERSAEETIALYDITKDICTALDEDRVFEIFRERINRYISIGDCRFLKEGADLAPYKDSKVLPLMIDKQSIGYLVAEDVRKEDEDKFHILSQQFLSGLKRVLLYRKVQELSITDGLTQIFNRRYFIERFKEEIKRAKKFKLKFSFLMVDIDHFKNYNDRYGHLVGDAILLEVARAVKENIRQIDFMGRYGGEEFSIILAETDKEQTRFAAERIRQAIESRQITVYDEDLKATVSLGLATFPDDARETQGLIEAKQAGRNKVCAYQAQK